MGAVAFGEGWLPRWYRGWSLLRRSGFGYEGREPLPQGRHFIIDKMAQHAAGIDIVNASKWLSDLSV